MKKNLSNICLVAIDGVGNKTLEINRVIDICCKDFYWKCVFHFSPNNLNNFRSSNGNIVLNQHINKMSYYEYNKFCINGLFRSIADYDFDYCLIIQEDGFIVNPNLWNDNFLNFDYIGAPWLKYKNRNIEDFGWLEVDSMKYRVGNGGFSLRSRKFLQETTYIEYPQNSINEDVYLTHTYGDYLHNKGIKFADVVTASQFSLETKNDLCDDLTKVFGFHGKHLLNDALLFIQNKIII